MTREEQRGGGWEEIVKLCWSMYGFVCVVGDGAGARAAEQQEENDE